MNNVARCTVALRRSSGGFVIRQGLMGDLKSPRRHGGSPRGLADYKSAGYAASGLQIQTNGKKSSRIERNPAEQKEIQTNGKKSSRIERLEEQNVALRYM